MTCHFHQLRPIFPQTWLVSLLTVDPADCLTYCFYFILVSFIFLFRISWLWDIVDVVLPSVYLNTRITGVHSTQFVRGRMREAYRVAQRAKVTNKPPVFGYIRYVYTNNVTTYLTDVSDLL